MSEGYSIRQLVKISGHSKAKLQRIKYYWLNKEPPSINDSVFTKVKHLIFDGTYFHKNGCLAVFMDNKKKKILYFKYIEKESYYNIYPVLISLKEAGLSPVAITLDGHKMVIRAVIDVWADVVVQRCLYHIQRQGLQWLRTYPKTQAGKELRYILMMVTKIRTEADKLVFLETYERWYLRYKGFINKLPRESVANIRLLHGFKKTL